MDAETSFPADLTVDDEVGPRIRLGLVCAEPVETRESGPALDTETGELADTLRGRFTGHSPSEIVPLAWARELYRAFGIDPTRTRPSSEALLRRVLKNKPLPRILNAVDVCNLCSLRFLLPIGLYDAGKLAPPVVLRRGRADESFEGIRKDAVHLEGRLVLQDRHGPFGNPTSDSARTCVDSGTTALWMVIFAPSSYPPDLMDGDIRFARSAIERHLAPEDGRVVTAGVPWGSPPG